MSEKKIAQYKNVLINFLDEIIKQFPEEGDIILIKFCIKKISANTLFNIFNTTIHKNDCIIKKMIKERNDDFFLNLDLPFDFFYGKNKIKYFHEIWKSDKLDDDTRSIMWDWINSLVNIIDSYNYEKISKKEYSKVLSQLKKNIKTLDKFIDRLENAHLYNKRVDICILFPRFIFENGDINYAIPLSQCK